MKKTLSLTIIAAVFAVGAAVASKSKLFVDGWYQPDSSGTYYGTSAPGTDICPGGTTLCATHYINEQADDFKYKR